jgi:hypothetical protein
MRRQKSQQRAWGFGGINLAHLHARFKILQLLAQLLVDQTLIAAGGELCHLFGFRVAIVHMNFK